MSARTEINFIQSLKYLNLFEFMFQLILKAHITVL